MSDGASEHAHRERVVLSQPAGVPRLRQKLDKCLLQRGLVLGRQLSSGNQGHPCCACWRNARVCGLAQGITRKSKITMWLSVLCKRLVIIFDCSAQCVCRGAKVSQFLEEFD